MSSKNSQANSGIMVQNGGIIFDVEIEARIFKIESACILLQVQYILLRFWSVTQHLSASIQYV